MLRCVSKIITLCSLYVTFLRNFLTKNKTSCANVPLESLKSMFSIVFPRFSFMRLLCRNNKVLYFSIVSYSYIYFANVVFDFLTQQHETAWWWHHAVSFFFRFLHIYNSARLLVYHQKKVFLFIKFFFSFLHWGWVSCVNNNSFRFSAAIYATLSP